MHIQHTSSAAHGQIYIGMINWGLMVAVICLVLGFKSSGTLAGAYGVAVTGTMLITSLLLAVVMWRLWRLPHCVAIPVLLGFVLVDGAFFAANAPKILQGGALWT